MKTFISILESLFSIVKIPLIIIAAVLVLFVLIVLFNYLHIRFIKKIKPKEGEHYRVKKQSIIKRLFVQAPRRYANDLINKDPEWFRHQGCICFVGRQGSGKTIALVHYTMQMQREYPKSKCISNLNYKYQDDELSDWRQLIDYQNDAGRDRGVIVQMDEMQNWFSSNMSRDFPPQMLEVICQNRKNRRIILGTSQVFCRLAKPIREQVTELRKCLTIFGCITFVTRYEPEINNDGDVEKLKWRGMYFFVHSDEIRNSYDTYKVIESISKSGFQANVINETTNKIYVDKKVIKKRRII